jgi:histone H3/H4
MSVENLEFWKKCSACKKPISFGAPYYLCSVSTCNGDRTGYVFCSIQCFETHLPGARHRDAGAIEKKAPDKQGPVRRIVQSSSPTSQSLHSGQPSATQNDVLIIASRLKDYIQARAQMNTSASVMDELSEHIRRVCEHAIDQARIDGRKTVMDRDLEFLRKLRF